MTAYMKWFAASALMGTVLAGCADLTVTRVTDDGNSTAVGQRYYLPKPVIIVAPQADGTVAVSVDYLPDKSHEYAVDTQSQFSSYTYQMSTDIRGLLTEVEFKADTTAVGQQLASSAGSLAAQLANYQSAQILANQTAINAAQTAYDAAKAAADAAHAALDSDKNNGITGTQLAADASAAAQADARLAVAQQALDRARSTSQAVAVSATAPSVIGATGPTMGNIIGSPTTWTGPSAISVPDKFGPVVFVVNDSYSKDAAGVLKEKVSLSAVTTELNDTTVLAAGDLQTGVVPKAQPAFATSTTALAPPRLLPPSQIVLLADKSVTFYFDRAVKAAAAKVETDATPPVAKTATATLAGDGKSITIDISQLAAGQYTLTVDTGFTLNSIGANATGTSIAKFTVK
jgi:hypothetical protein